MKILIYRSSPVRQINSATIRVFAILFNIWPLLSQGTIQFGFEEFPIGATPPFVQSGLPQFPATIQNNASSVFVLCPPYEGQKFLVGVGSVSIQSPNGEPIKAFNLHLFVNPLAPPAWLILIENAQSTRSSGGVWETIQRTFDTPVQSVKITALEGIETIPGYFAIDGVEFTTVPEPQTFWLLTLGLGAILLRRSKSLKTQSG